MSNRSCLVVSVAVAVSLLASACGSDSGQTDPNNDSQADDSSVAPETTSSSTSSVIPSTSIDNTPPTDDSVATQDFRLEGALVPVAAGWELLDRSYFVFDVAGDDRLNLRAGPGIENAIVGSMAPAAEGLTMFGETVFVGDDRWSPVKVEDGAGWVNLDYVRPTAVREGGNPRIEGDNSNPALLLASDAAEMDLGSLVEMVGPSGLTISTDAYVDDDDVVVTAADLEELNDEAILWGHEDGSGEPIERTLADQLDHIRGLTALTSTEAIGFNTPIGSGNTIDNAAQWFPDTSFVEYHFAGTNYFGMLDWSSVRFVFDSTADDGGSPRLIAIIESDWTI